MLRRAIALALVLISLVGCFATETTSTPPEAVALEKIATTPSVVPTQTIIPTGSPTLPPASVTPALSISPTASPPPDDLSIAEDQLLVYPAGPVYEGDSVTFQVWAHVPPQLSTSQVTVEVWVEQELVGTGIMNPRMLGGDLIGHMALFPWAWESNNREGLHQIHVRLDPEDQIQVGDENPNNNEITVDLAVRSRGDLPLTAATREWVKTEAPCCHIYAVSGTAAHRDLEQLQPLIENAVEQAADMIQATPKPKLDIYLIDRVIGQGGYSTGNVIVISYLDRLYSGNSVPEVLVHEAVHALDAQFAPRRTSFLAEGVAVWATGGHYKQEELDLRMAALLESENYIPLPQLIDNFVLSQHEIAYLQAGGFIAFLVHNYGWPRVRAFYADTESENEMASTMIDQGTQRHFQKSLQELEQEWLAQLRQMRPPGRIVEDLTTTIRYFDMMRRYQQLYDPTAYFLRAWLPSPTELVERKTTAELARHPQQSINVTLEVMLIDSDEALRRQDYDQAKAVLDSIERAIGYQGVFPDPLGNHYHQIVTGLMRDGYQVQRVRLQGNRAEVQVNRPDQWETSLLQMVLNRQEWIRTQ